MANPGHSALLGLSLLAALIAVATTGVALFCRRHDEQNASPPPPGPDSTSAALLTDVTDRSGLSFVHTVAGGYFFPDIMSSGGGLADFDCDGDLDIYLLNGAKKTADRNAADASVAVNRLFLQESDGRFRDATERSGLGDEGYGMGLAIGDVNNDGFPDVYVTNYGPDRLFMNQGDGTFLDVTAKAGIDNARWGASTCLFDYDRDGWLDLFVANYADYHEDRPCYDGHGGQDFCSPDVFPSTADRLYRNVSGENGDDDRETRCGPGGVRFVDVSFSSGIALKRGLGLGVVCADFNGDCWPDVYVANDRQANVLWLNQRDGTFQDEAVLQGVAYDGAGQPQASMGIACGDIDADGRFDLLVTHMRGESYAFYLSGGLAGYTESASSWGITGSSFPWTGFGAAFVDLEHDGDLDLMVVNGRVERPPSRDAKVLGSNRPRPTSEVDANFRAMYAETNQLLLNDGTGRFSPFHSGSDPFVNDFAVSRGLALGDIDNDGDLDMLVTNADDKARLYRNDAPKRGNWLLVRATDPQLGNRDAYGAVVTVVAAGQRRCGLLSPGYSYCSSSDPRVHFGLGEATVVDRVEVLWPNGRSEAFDGGPVNRVRLLERGRGRTIEEPEGRQETSPVLGE